MNVIIQSIFKACATYDEKSCEKAGFYYDCDDVIKSERYKGLIVKKNASLKEVPKCQRVNLMNRVAQAHHISVRYYDEGVLIYVKKSKEHIETHEVELEWMNIVQGNLSRAAEFVTGTCYYSRYDIGEGIKRSNVILENLDMCSQEHRIEIIDFFQSLLPNYNMVWQKNILQLYQID